MSHTDTFPPRHLGSTPDETAALAKEVGYDSPDALVDAAVPPSIRLDKELTLPQPLGESAALARLSGIMDKNVVAKSYIGQGYYNCHTPAPIQQQPPPWMQQGGQPQQQPPQQMPQYQAYQPPPAAAMNPANQQLLDMYQQQMDQMAKLQQHQQDQFQADLEEQRKHLERKQQEHKAVLEQQKTLCNDQVGIILVNSFN